MLILFAGHNNYTKNRETKQDLIRLYEHYMFFIDLFDIRKSIKSLFDKKKKTFFKMFIMLTWFTVLLYNTLKMKKKKHV